MSSARDEILEKLKKATYPEPEKPDFDAHVYHPIDSPLEEAFKKNLEAVNGCVYLCSSENETFEKLRDFVAKYPSQQIYCAEKKLQKLLNENQILFSEYPKEAEQMEVGITSCEFLIAHTGSIMVSSALEGGRQMSIYPPVHVVIAQKKQLVDYLDAAYANIQKKYKNELPSQITLITGPSRTADIEKTLVMGAHGPRELHLFMY